MVEETWDALRMAFLALNLIMRPGPSFVVPAKIWPPSKSLIVIRAVRGSMAEILTGKLKITPVAGNKMCICVPLSKRLDEHAWRSVTPFWTYEEDLN